MAAKVLASDDQREMSREDAAALYALRVTWEGHYELSLSGGVWRAVPAEAAAAITADSAAELRLAVPNDYAERAERARRLMQSAGGRS